MKLIKFVAVFFAVLVLSGCNGGYATPPMNDYEKHVYLSEHGGRTPLSKEAYYRMEREKSLKEKEDFEKNLSSYEVSYNAEYQKIKDTLKDNTVTKWVQPSNKKVTCEVEVNFGKVDRTLNDSYKLFWDGSCKDGKVSGLGRVFERSDIYEQSLISIYKDGKISNACIIERSLENLTLAGECRGNELDFPFDFAVLAENGTINNFSKISTTKITTSKKPTYNIVTKVTDEIGNFNFEQKIGTYGNIDNPILIEMKSPFLEKKLQKLYPNFGYMVDDKSIHIANKYDMFNGHQLQDYENSSNGAEYKNNKLVRRVQYPQNFISHYASLAYEMKEASEKAYSQYKISQIMKKKYIKKICKENIKIDFMDNDEYKEICSQKHQLAVIEKIKKKEMEISEVTIAKLEKQKFNAQQQKEEQHRQELLQIERNRISEIRRHNQETEAAADTANFQQGMKNLTDQINNMTPKTYNVNMYHY